MAITKEKKLGIVKDLATVLGDAESVVFVNFHGLKVPDVTALRRDLRERGVGFRVAKKTLIRRVLEGLKIDGTAPELPGELALAFPVTQSAIADSTASARGVYEFEKKTKGGVKIVGGVWEKKFVDVGMMVSIASIPSREMLYGQLVNLINSPIQRFVIALNQIALKK